jgi:hypothetical protein
VRDPHLVLPEKYRLSYYTLTGHDTALRALPCLGSGTLTLIGKDLYLSLYLYM